jgi:L-fucose mutarotase
MLKGIDPVLSPDLLGALAAMGHGDEVCLADANFPAQAIAGARAPIRLPGLTGARVLEAVLSVLPLDTFVDAPAAVMQVVGAPETIPEPVRDYQRILDRSAGRAVVIESLERFAFYERARGAFAVVATGELRAYGNILLRKGVIASA